MRPCRHPRSPVPPAPGRARSKSSTAFLRPESLRCLCASGNRASERGPNAASPGKPCPSLALGKRTGRARGAGAVLALAGCALAEVSECGEASYSKLTWKKKKDKNKTKRKRKERERNSRVMLRAEWPILFHCSRHAIQSAQN